MSVNLIHIVPRIPPSTDGLGDYALILGCQIRASHSFESGFIVGDHTWNGQKDIEGFPVYRIDNRSSTALLAALAELEPPYTILLHYVGYGYAKRGAPIWLVDGLEKWHRYNSEMQIVTMFHEIYAKGPLWTSSFWLSPLQKYLAARLARLSDVCVTSRQSYAEILRVLSRNKHSSIATLPVFSNVGEPKQSPLPLKKRKRRLVVFGSRGSRSRVYEKSITDLKTACRALGIEEVIDIGPEIDLSFSQINGIPLIQMGKLPPKEISDLLSDSIAGFLNYNTALLAKSGVFAAYSAYGLIPVIAACEPVRADGLEPNTHYWIANPHEKILHLEDGQKISENTYAWYQNHSLAIHAKTFATEIITL